MRSTIEPLELRRLLSVTPSLTGSFESFTNIGTTAPADAQVAVGPVTLVTVVNSRIGFYRKDGASLYQATLQDFFGAPATEQIVDPTVSYDQYRGRFVVAANAFTQTGAYVRLAVSDDSDASGDDGGKGTWSTAGKSLDASTFQGALALADQPHLSVGPDAIYIAAAVEDRRNSTGEARLWIVRKDPFYGTPGESIPSFSTYQPLIASGATDILNHRIYPASTFGQLPAGVGTYIVVPAPENAFNSSSDQDVVHVIQVNDPLGTPTFTRSVVSLGVNTQGPDVPPPNRMSGNYTLDNQDVEPRPIWRDGSLWATETVAPVSPSPDAGQSSVHWMRINTASMTLAEQGFVGGEDIAPETRTGFGSIAVNAAGENAVHLRNHLKSPVVA